MSDICGCGIVIGLQTLKAGSVKQSETPQTMTRTIPSPAPKGFKMKEEILKKLKELKPSLYEKYGIENFAIFGSVAKGEENKDSDIDIAILKAKRKNLFLRLSKFSSFISKFNSLSIASNSALKSFGHFLK